MGILHGFIFFLSRPLLSTYCFVPKPGDLQSIKKSYQYQHSTPRRWAREMFLSMFIQEQKNKHVKAQRTWSVSYGFPHINTILCSYPQILSSCTAVSSTVFAYWSPTLLLCNKYYIYIILFSWGSKLHENEKVWGFTYFCIGFRSEMLPIRATD